MNKSISRKKLIVIFVLIGVVVIAATALLLIKLFGQGTSSSDTSNMQTSQVEKGTISTDIEGTGNLGSSDSLAVKIPKGLVIKEVKVQNGQAISAGDVIATVTKASAASELLTVRESIDSAEDELDALSDSSDSTSTEYLQRLVLESELEELNANERVLAEILESETIVAPYSGTIANLNLEVGSTVEASAQNSSNNSNSTNSSNSSNSSSSNQSGNSPSTMRGMSNTNEAQYSVTLLVANPENNTISKIDNTITPFAVTMITASNELQIAAPRTGAIPQKDIATKGNVPVNYTGTITWDNTNPTFSEGVSYAATIVLTANPGYSFADDILVEIDNTLLVNWQVFGTDEGNRLRIVALFEKTSSSSGGQSPSSPSTESSTNKGDTGISGSGSSGSSPSSGSSTEAGSTSGSTSSNSLLTTIATIGSNQKVKVNINVDELDILTVQEGQKAEVTLDALENQIFEGTVTSISSEAASGSDSIKYAVSVELNKTDEMLIGMSAAATIKIKEVNDVLIIPVNALQESGDTVFVYTGADSNGNLYGEVEIKTGLSDGTNVEVLEGLSENDTVYYTRVTTDNNNQMGGMNGMPGGGGIIGGGPVIMGRPN